MTATSSERAETKAGADVHEVKYVQTTPAPEIYVEAVAQVSRFGDTLSIEFYSPRTNIHTKQMEREIVLRLVMPAAHGVPNAEHLAKLFRSVGCPEPVAVTVQ